MIREEIDKYILHKTGENIEDASGNFGDYCLNPGALARAAQKANQDLSQFAQTIADELKTDFAEMIEKAEFRAGFLNISLTKQAYLSELRDINQDIDSYLADSENADKTIVFDYSSPNIAKPFSVGHLRSTVIGQANYNIHKALGYNTIGINHLGDWGTQFGKLIVAIKQWGDEQKIEANPIEELNALYVRFHEEAEKDESLGERAREWFKKLEDNDAEARELWEKCVRWSMVEFEKIYDQLGVKIDEAKGESFYEDKLEEVIDELKEKGLLKESQGAQIVELENLPPALIQKQDGATLYMTRDLAALKYRLETYKPEKIIYHVGNDQNLHFRQLEAVAIKLGWVNEGVIVFAGHGMIRLPEGKMSTREGRTVLLKDLIDEAIQRARSIIDEKDSSVADKDHLASKIAISAIKYADLSQNRKSDIVFTFDKMISLKGNSAPYLQYSYARMASLISRVEETYGDIQPSEYLGDESLGLARAMLRFKSVLENAASTSCPNFLADYIFELTNIFSAYYEKTRIISDSREETAKNLYIVVIAKNILGRAFEILSLAKIDRI